LRPSTPPSLPEERDELLKCLLVAASVGGEAVVQRLKERLLVHAGSG
jgi:hypothetical protein